MKKRLVAVIISALPMIWAAGNPTAGKEVYDRACKNCHGAQGEGNPNIAKMMKVEMKPLSGSEVQGMSDQQIEDVIEKGKGKMHAIKSVTPTQAADVVAYIRTLKK